MSALRGKSPFVTEEHPRQGRHVEKRKRVADFVDKRK